MQELFSVGQEVIYNGRRSPNVRGKKVQIDLILKDENKAVCSFNGDGYIFNLQDLSKPKGTDTWDGKVDFSDARRKNPRFRIVEED